MFPLGHGEVAGGRLVGPCSHLLGSVRVKVQKSFHEHSPQEREEKR